MSNGVRSAKRGQAEDIGEEQTGYLELVLGNTDFRRLWAGQIVSLLGDWFNTIALYVLVTRLTGSALALGGVFIFKLLPWAVVSPLAGLVADRFNRRRLMIGADLLRAVVVLGFLLIDTPGEVPLLYTLIVVQVVLGAVFLPAKNASIPNITTPRELLTANALMSATWSVMLAVGAALGGFATEAFGTHAVFVIDSITYLVSAVFIYRATIPQDTDDPDGSGLLRTAAREIVDGWRRMRAHPHIGRIALSKASWAVGGGALVYMVALLGEEVAPSTLAAGIGVLFMARGIGTGIGPIVARTAFKDQRRWPVVLGGCFAFSGLGYLAVGFAPWVSAAWGIGLLIVLIAAAHAASGANWVLSTVMLQERTEDRYRGRVFGTEWLLVMATESLSIFIAGVLLEARMLSLRGGFCVFALLQIAAAVLWWLFVVPREREYEGRKVRG